MSLPDTVCVVLLTHEAYAALDGYIDPYVKEGRRGKYLHGTSAIQNGAFIDIIFKPEQCDGSVKSNMTVSVPANFVKFMVTGSDDVSIGFSPSE